MHHAPITVRNNSGRQTDRQTDRQRLTDRQTDRDRETERDRHRERQRETETDRDRETQRHRETETDRQRDSDRQTDRQTDRDRERQRETETERQTETQRDRDRQTDRQRAREGKKDGERGRERDGEGEKHRDRQTDRHAERQSERDREKPLCTFVTKGQNCSCDRQLNKLKSPRTVQITTARRREKGNTIALRYMTVCLQTQARPMGPKYRHSRDNHIKNVVLHPVSRLVPLVPQRSLSYTAPMIWNKLPHDVRPSQSTPSVKQTVT